MRVAIIGAGNMGTAIVRGAIDAGVLRPDELLIIDTDSARREFMRGLGCSASDLPGDALDAEQIILAVKPQSFEKFASAIGALPHPTIVISIMAGLSSTAIRARLGEHAHVIRAMPNTPCRIRRGMTAIALGEGTHAGDDELAQRIFISIGDVVTVEEDELHAITAVSGSGPAYVFLLAEAMQQAAEQLGLSHALARALVQQTLAGAGDLLRVSEETATELRQAVTSPGGTTAAALEHMFEKELPEIVAEAILFARNRSEELSG